MRPVLRPLALALAVVAAPLLGLPADAANATVTVSNFAFTPSTVSVNPGDLVTWTWASGTHSVVAGAPGSPGATWCTIRSSGSCTTAFATPGGFPYFCGIHPAMIGRVNVLGTPPAVSIGTPTAGSTVSGTITVSGTASAGAGLDKVEVRIGSGPFLVASGTSSWSVSLDTTGAALGANTITARATAADQQTATALVPVTVDNPPTVDLQVVGVQGTSSNAAAPGSSLVRGSVRNNGNSLATAGLLFEYEYKGAWRTFATSTITVAGFSTNSRLVNWQDNSLVGTFPVRVTVDPAGALAEFDEGNNVGTGSTSFVSAQLPFGLDVDEP